jgi:hypothetical protein
MSVNERLLGVQQMPLNADDFVRVEDRLLLDVVYQRGQQQAVVTTDELCDSLDDVLAAHVQSLVKLPLVAESELSRLQERLVLSVLDWRLTKMKAELSRLRELWESAADGSLDNPPPTELYGPRIGALRLAIQQLNHARGALLASGQPRAETGDS